MEQSSSYDEETIRHQFDCKCKLAWQGEKIDYERYLSYRQKHEILFCELSETEFRNSVINLLNSEDYMAIGVATTCILAFRRRMYDQPTIPSENLIVRIILSSVNIILFHVWTSKNPLSCLGELWE